MAYLLDANVFIQAKNLHYGFDFCPAFWAWVVRENRAGRVFSIEKIGDELQSGSDDLAKWAAEQGEQLFLPADQAMLPTLSAVSSWVGGHGYSPAAVSTFLQVADYYLVAHARAHNHVVVTHEIPSASVNKVKIPDVCLGLGIKFMTPFGMLRKERARFVLGPEKD